MQHLKKPARGAILLMTIMIMGTAALVGFLGLSRTTIGRIVDSDQLVKASAVRMKVYGCLDEALIHLQADANFSEPDVVTGDATCTLTITTPQAGQRLVAVRYTENNLSYGLNVTVTEDDIDILSITPTLP
jgi:hypothetical protein